MLISKPHNGLSSRPIVLTRAFYERAPETVARQLLGKILVHRFQGKRLAGRIIETEAYLGEADPASHAYGGKSPFNAVLFGPAGRSDVYLIYGLYYCMNVSCLPDGQPGGVLIRALTPLWGIATMARLRGLKEGVSARLLTGGPGKLCQALAITRGEDHDIDVTRRSSQIHLLDDEYLPRKIFATPRIGISKAIDLPLRFLIEKGCSDC